MAQGIKFYEPVRRYLEQLKWKVYSKASLPTSGGTTWVELALDFYASTRIPLAKAGQEDQGTLAEQGRLFAVIVRRGATLSKGRPAPADAMESCGALASLGLSWTGGFSGEAALFNRAEVSYTGRAYDRVERSDEFDQRTHGIRISQIYRVLTG